MNLTDSYKLSVYVETGLIKESDYCTVKLVVSSLDGKRYVKKEYADNKNQVFSVLQEIHSANLSEIKEIIDGRIIIEEFVEGVTLEKFLQNGTPEPKRAKIIFNGILSALNELHKNGIVHRDVKPSNIIIRPDGTAVLIDFGISKLFNAAADKDTSLLGTVGYAPPEQFGFASTDYRSDVYSFGVTAEKLGIKKYDRIIKKCKAFDPSKRYANAGKVLFSVRLMTPLIITLAVIIVLAVAVFVQKVIEKPDKVEPVQLPSYSESSSYVGYQPVQTEPVAPTEQHTETVTEAPTYGFTTTRRLQLFDHQKPYRVIETDEHIYSILVMDDAADERIIVPLGNGGEIEVHYIVDRNNLKLTLTDGKHRFETEFSAAQLTMGEQLTNVVMTEIVFYDITGDGVFEILPMFCHCKFGADNGMLTKTVNSWEGYCISYDSSKGFSQCSGELRVRGSQSENVFFSGGNIYADNQEYRYVVSDGKFVKE